MFREESAKCRYCGSELTFIKTSLGKTIKVLDYSGAPHRCQPKDGEERKLLKIYYNTSLNERGDICTITSFSDGSFDVKYNQDEPLTYKSWQGAKTVRGALIEQYKPKLLTLSEWV